MKSILAGIGSRIIEEIVGSILKSSNVNLVCTENEQAFLNAFTQGKYSCVIVKSGFAEQDDGTYLNQIKEQIGGRSIPIILILDEDDPNAPQLRKTTPFTVDIPFDNSQIKNTVNKALEQSEKRILICDDSQSIRKFIEVNLRDTYDLTLVEDGQQAIDKLKNDNFDIVITDVEMPNVNGYELCRHIRNTPGIERLPVLMVSTLSQGLDIERGFESGAVDYLTKPIDADELKSRLKTILATQKLKKRERILVIDDSKTVRNILFQGLNQQGFEVLLAEDGEIGVATAKLEAPDLIITDAVMPNLDGYGVCRQLKADPDTKSTPIIFLSSKEAMGAKRRGIATGAAVYVTKPFNMDRLLVIIERILSERRLTLEADQLRNTFKKYFSKQVADWILDNPDRVNLSGQLLDATVLFSDVRGFTNICKDLGAKEIVSLMNRYFTIMEDVIFRYHGTVDKFIGDAVLAIFGVPFSQGNDAFLAVQAANDMNIELEKLNRERTANGEKELHIGIGITTGSVVAGNVGSERRLDFTIMGNPVNLASRLQGKALGNEVLIDQQTYENVRDKVQVETLEPFMVKGYPDEVQAYKLISIGKELEAEEKQQ
jgi:adenylate cyclase